MIATLADAGDNRDPIRLDSVPPFARAHQVRKHPDRHGMGRALFGLIMGILGTVALGIMFVAIFYEHSARSAQVGYYKNL